MIFHTYKALAVDIPAPNEADIVDLVLDEELQITIESDGYPDGYSNHTIEAWYFRNIDYTHADVVVTLADLYVRHKTYETSHENNICKKKQSNLIPLENLFSSKVEDGYDFLELYKGFAGGETSVALLASYTGSIVDYSEVGELTPLQGY